MYTEDVEVVSSDLEASLVSIVEGELDCLCYYILSNMIVYF
jgi:hypothetical protein